MKKVIITLTALAIIVALGVTLVACNNATTQGQLENPLGFDHDRETFVYDALDTYTGDEGTYTVRIQGYDSGATISDFDGDELANVEKGILVTGELSIGGNSSSTGCYFKLVGSSTTYMIPVASYTVHTEDGKQTFKLHGTYGGNMYSYTRTVGDKTDSGSFKISGTYFDNNEFHQMLRTVSTYASGLSLAYTMPLVTASEASAVSITATSNSTEKVTTPFTSALLDAQNEPLCPDGMVCFVVKINRSTQVVGASQTLYYSVQNITSDIEHPNVRFMQHVLVKMVEPYKVDGKATFTATSDEGEQIEKPIQMEYTLRDAYIGEKA